MGSFFKKPSMGNHFMQSTTTTKKENISDLINDTNYIVMNFNDLVYCLLFVLNVCCCKPWYIISVPVLKCESKRSMAVRLSMTIKNLHKDFRQYLAIASFISPIFLLHKTNGNT